MGTVMGANILAAADSLRQAFDRTPGMHAAIEDDALTIHIDVKTLGSWALTWHAKDGDDYDRSLDFRPEGYVIYYDGPVVYGIRIDRRQALDFLNAPFAYDDIGWEAEFGSVTDPRLTGMVDLALALAAVTKLNEKRERSKTLQPHPGVAVPTRLIWDS